MNIRVVAIAAMIAGQAAQAGEAVSLKLTLLDARVIHALKAAWESASDGTKNVEASFRLDGTPYEYEVVALPFSNGYTNQTVKIVPGHTFALFHVHPGNRDAAPSAQDRRVADQYQLQIVTIHRSGLYAYDPVTKKTFKLATSLQLAKAAKSPEISQSGLTRSLPCSR